MRLRRMSVDTLDDYLSEIYRLEEGKGTVSTSDVAEKLDVSAPTATAMLKKLAQRGYVDHERYKGVRTTDRGRKRALRTLRRHRLAEKLLVDTLGVQWEDVHEEAHRLEHALSDEIVDRIAEVLGDPEVCPHGSPIPSQDGRVSDHVGESMSLWDLKPRARADVLAVRDEDPRLLSRLSDIGLYPGIEVVVKKKTRYDDGLELEIDSRREFLGRSEAQAIVVRQ